MRMLPVGPSAVLFEVDDLQQVEELYAELRGRQRGVFGDELIDIVPAARTVLVAASPGSRLLSALVDELSNWHPTGVETPVGPLHELPTRYDGEDLPFVCEFTGLTVDEVIDLHATTEYRVAFCGFAPGFAYIAGVPQALHLPRRTSPRTSVSAGSVALAGEFTAVYPRASPGGWQLVGSTTVALWDSERNPPNLLAPGSRVRFVPWRG